MEILLLLLVVISLMILATTRLKLHPVLSLTGAAILSGLFMKVSPVEIVKLITAGFGQTLSGIGLVIAFGTMIGVYLEKTKGTWVIARKILGYLPDSKSPLAMNLVGFIISVPVFCDSGFIILSSLNKALSKRTGIPLVVFAVCLSAGLYATHVFVPPTPGPLAAAAVLQADIGLIMMLGLVVAIPVSLSGAFWGMYLKKQYPEELPVARPQEEAMAAEEESLLLTLLPVLVPIILIAAASVVSFLNNATDTTFIEEAILFLGAPVIALLCGVIAALLIHRKIPATRQSSWVEEALKQAGSIVLITGAGGAFGHVIRQADLAGMLETELSWMGGGLVLIFLVAAILKSAQGSSTVAIITTAAIAAPILPQFGLETDIDKALTVLAIGAGALTVSHINDSYFWVVSQFSELSVKKALKTHTVATLIQGVTGILVVILLRAIL